MRRGTSRPFDNVMLSVLFEANGTPYIWDITGRMHDALGFEYLLRKKIDGLRQKGRKRVTLWARPRSIADQHGGMSPVLWVGSGGGPGHGAFKIGSIPTNKLEETILLHIGMMA
jgi:hypothetical protein